MLDDNEDTRDLKRLFIKIKLREVELKAIQQELNSLKFLYYEKTKLLKEREK
jgi:hypothetical protein